MSRSREKLASKSRVSSTSPPELERIKMARVSGNLTVLRMRLQEAQEHFALGRKMQSYVIYVYSVDAKSSDTCWGECVRS